MSIYFYHFPIISPLGRVWPIIWITWIPFTQGYFVPSLVEIDLEEKMKMWKVYSKQTNRQTDCGRTDRWKDDRWSEKLTWAFSSGELKRNGNQGITWKYPLMDLTQVYALLCNFSLIYKKTMPFVIEKKVLYCICHTYKDIHLEALFLRRIQKPLHSYFCLTNLAAAVGLQTFCK